MPRRLLIPAIAVLTLVTSTIAVLPAAAGLNKGIVAHRLIVAVEQKRKLAVLVLISRNGGAPAGAVATPTRPVAVLLDDAGIYRVKATVDVSCKGSCGASYRVVGSANHKLVVVPSCRPKGAGFVCSKVTIVKVY